MDFRDIREACLEANRDLPALGLVDLTFGNVSVSDRARAVFAIKPSGVDYAALKAEDMVIVDFEGKIVSGTLRPSSDTPTHRRLLRGFEGVTSVVHTHSRNAVAFAQAVRSIPCLGTTHADFFNGEVPVTRLMTPAEVGGNYEWETGSVILERFRELRPLEVPAVLVAGHGPFTWGPTAAKAVETAQALEIIAEMALKTLALEPVAAGLPAHVLRKHFDRKHGESAYYGQPGSPA